MVAPYTNSDEAAKWLERVGRMPDQDIDLFETAMALSVQKHPGISIDKYRSHIRKLCRDLEETHISLLSSAPDTLEKQVQSIQMVFAQKHGYSGSQQRYDDLDNADLIRVMDRRMGMPITLCILCIHICKQIGWDACGLNFPGHFLMRLDMDGNRTIIDPFQSCRSLNAAELRLLLKEQVDEDAELSADYYQAASNRDILMRLHNNVKIRLIENEEYEEALQSITFINKVAPQEYRLNLDAGILQARLEQPIAAIESLEIYIQNCPNATDLPQAQALVSEIKNQLN